MANIFPRIIIFISEVDTINSEFYQDNDSSTDYMRIIRVRQKLHLVIVIYGL